MLSVKWSTFCIFALVSAYFFIISFPDIGAFLTTGTLSFHQLFSKTATGNWFPDRFGRSGVLRYDPAKAQPGYTLYTLAPDLSAHLIDMDGREVHRWFVPKEKVMPGAVKSARTFFGLLEPQVEGGHLFPNGDLLLVYEIEMAGDPGHAAS